MEPFRIDVDEAVLEDLRRRLASTRWPARLDGTGWSWGTDERYLRELVDHWLHRYDWRAEERRLNALPQFRAEVQGLGLHLVRAGRPGGMPLLLLHGWPGSFVQMLDLVHLLASGEPSFDVVAASLPGFGFSDAPTRPGETVERMADRFHALMTEVLGHRRYAVHGTDFGGGVAEAMAARHPGALIGLHTGGTSPRAEGVTDADPPEVRRYAADVAAWRAEEVGYSAIQGTRPQSLAPALSDSPVGLAAWMVEKFRRWSDCGGDVERRFPKDRLLTHVMVYWVTGTIGSSMRLYREPAEDPDLRDSPVPIAHLMPAHDMLPTPRAWIERRMRIDRWTPLDRGGHFLEEEEPALVADDLRAFLAGRS